MAPKNHKPEAKQIGKPPSKGNPEQPDEPTKPNSLPSSSTEVGDGLVLTAKTFEEIPKEIHNHMREYFTVQDFINLKQTSLKLARIYEEYSWEYCFFEGGIIKTSVNSSYRILPIKTFALPYKFRWMKTEYIKYIIFPWPTVSIIIQQHLTSETNEPLHYFHLPIFFPSISTVILDLGQHTFSLNTQSLQFLTSSPRLIFENYNMTSIPDYVSFSNSISSIQLELEGFDTYLNLGTFLNLKVLNIKNGSDKRSNTLILKSIEKIRDLKVLQIELSFTNDFFEILDNLPKKLDYLAFSIEIFCQETEVQVPQFEKILSTRKKIDLTGADSLHLKADFTSEEEPADFATHFLKKIDVSSRLKKLYFDKMFPVPVLEDISYERFSAITRLHLHIHGCDVVYNLNDIKPYKNIKHLSIRFSEMVLKDPSELGDDPTAPIIEGYLKKIREKCWNERKKVLKITNLDLYRINKSGIFFHYAEILQSLVQSGTVELADKYYTDESVTPFCFGLNPWTIMKVSLTQDALLLAEELPNLEYLEFFGAQLLPFTLPLLPLTYHHPKLKYIFAEVTGNKDEADSVKVFGDEGADCCQFTYYITDDLSESYLILIDVQSIQKKYASELFKREELKEFGEKDLLERYENRKFGSLQPVGKAINQRDTEFLFDKYINSLDF